MRFKSFFFSSLMSVLLSAALFFLVVFLGMKYHWVEAIKKDSQAFTELKLPAQVDGKNVNDPQIVTPQTAESVQAKVPKTEIVKDTTPTSPLASMTKKQVLAYCKKRFNTQGFSEDAITVAVGNCVVNNYQEPYEEITATQGDNYKQVGFSTTKPSATSTNRQQILASTQPQNSKNTQKPSRKNSRQAKVFLNAIRHRCAFEINKQNLLSAHEKKLLIETCVTDLSQQ